LALEVKSLALVLKVMALALAFALDIDGKDAAVFW